MSDATLLAIAGSRLAATVSTLGAELQTLRDAAGRDLLWDGDPAVWTGRAPLLFPIVGRLRDDRYRWEGRTFTLPQHGFARRRTFEVVTAGPDRVTLALTADAETRAVYPFAFRLEVTHAITGARIETTARVVNEGDAPMPASFGFHPGFRWPLPEGGAREDHAVVFEAEEDARILRPRPDGLLDPAGEPSPVKGKRLALSDALFAGGALVFTDLRSRRLTFEGPEGPRLAIDFPDTPHLGLWTKPGAGAAYLCVEPWQGYADTEEASGDLNDKPGLVWLAAEESRVFRMGVEVVD